MKIAVTGATGNVGTRVVDRLRADAGVEQVVGIASRLPELPGAPDPPAAAAGGATPVTWQAIDLGTDTAPAALAAALDGIDAVIHLAWLLQPSRRPALMERVNLGGTRKVLAAALAAGVGAVVHASSLGAYSEGPQDRAVDESWPTGGLHTSTYSRQKAAAERLLDEVEAQHPELRVVRIRPALVLQAAAGAEQGRYFLGRVLSRLIPSPAALPVVPLPGRLHLQVVHTEDIADLFVRAALDPAARGAYNGAADPVLDPAALAGALHARRVPVPAAVLRGVVDLSWRLGLQPTDPGWVDLGLLAPTMDSGRARRELGWTPSHDARDVLREALEGAASGAGADTPPLRPR